jgi:hypothetical protein
MNPHELLEKYFAQANDKFSPALPDNSPFAEKIDFICRCSINKAPIRFMLACLLAKIHRPELDIRKPYTEIGGEDSFSGRTYDEKYVQGFLEKYSLPHNATTAFLTPALRNIDRVLTLDLTIVGRPKEAYTHMLELLDAIHTHRVLPENFLIEFLRRLSAVKEENEGRMGQLLAGLNQSEDKLTLSSEQIATLLAQHLNCKNSSRLPVLIVAAAYQSVEQILGEQARPLRAHNAADKQTRSLGDVEITLSDETHVVTCYEVKDKRVTEHDIKIALTKIAKAGHVIDNYIFVTTDMIEIAVLEHAKTAYENHGVEIAILDCLGFARHFLHFFHRSRAQFLENYQNLVLNEPESSVSQSLKEAFLALRRQAESD